MPIAGRQASANDRRVGGWEIDLARRDLRLLDQIDAEVASMPQPGSTDTQERTGETTSGGSMHQRTS
jgi:hypothetical protein